MGFEVLVRPMIFPSIRPAAPPQPVQGSTGASSPCTFSGPNGEVVNFTSSWNYSLSKSRQTETKRRYDVARVYQVEDDGTINKDNFVDVKNTTKLQLKGGKQPGTTEIFVDPNAPAQPGTTPFISDQGVVYYAKTREADNIEVKLRDQVEDNPDAPPGD